MGPSDLLNDGATFSAYGYLVGFVLISIAAPVYLKKQNMLTPGAIIISVLALCFLVIPIVGSFYPLPDAPVSFFPYVFAADMALGAVWLVLQRRRSNDVIEKIEADLEDIGIRYGIKHDIGHVESVG